MRTVKRGNNDYKAERDARQAALTYYLGMGDSQAAVALAIASLETQFGRIADLLEDMHRMMKEDMEDV